MPNRDSGSGYREAQRRIAEAKSSGSTFLELSELGLTALPPEIGSLRAVQELNLSENLLTELPPEIGSLNAVQTLDLSENQLTALPPEIGSLNAVQTLYLYGNELTALPPEIGSLNAVQTLDLNSNQLTALPPEIGSFKAVQELGLADNLLTVLPPEIGSLNAVQTLDLSENQLTALPPEIGSLNSVRKLDLTNNQLTALPPEICQLEKLKELYLHKNPKLGLPPEVLGPTWDDVMSGNKQPTPPRVILKYYFSTLEGAKSLREVKLILVGRGEVGKSTLADVLQGKPFRKSRPPTEGIEITPWKIKPKGGQAVVRIWDFGGQEILHGTHQFFLTRRAIYVVMVDGRDDRYHRDAEYWLKLVRAYGAESHVILVMNRQGQCPFDLDRRALAKKYGLSLDVFFPTECEQKKTITPVRTGIRRIVGEILSAQEKFPAKWWKIKTHLEEMNEDYLADSAYRELCAKHGIVNNDEQDQLLDRLNELGVIVHFSDHALADLKVLVPEWATDGVYRVITNEKLREKKHGKLKASELMDILPTERWPENHHRQYVLDLMQKFDLCFPAEGERNTYIVPELLPQQTPECTDWDAKECLVFRYKYPILPHGVLPRFISKTHMMSEGRHRWRSGVVVAKEGAEALVRADYDQHTVDIWVRGEYRDARRALLTIIRSGFDEIQSRIKGLNEEEMVAVPGYPKVFVPYRDMILDWRDAEQSVRVTIEGRREAVLLEDILSGVESRTERVKAAERAAMEIEDGKRPMHVHGDILASGARKMRDDKSTIIVGDVSNSQVGQTLTNCRNIIQEQPSGEKRELLEVLEQQVAEILERLPEGKKKNAAEKGYMELVEQVTSDEPDRRWYSVSAEGLIEASKFAKDFTGNIAGTIGNLGKLIWGDYTPPSIG